MHRKHSLKPRCAKWAEVMSEWTSPPRAEKWAKCAFELCLTSLSVPLTPGHKAPSPIPYRCSFLLASHFPLGPFSLPASYGQLPAPILEVEVFPSQYLNLSKVTSFPTV